MGRQRIQTRGRRARERPVGNLEELADLYLEERQFARAKALYDKVIASRSDSLDAFYRRGLAELELGDASAALADLDLVVGKEPKYDFNRAIGLLAHARAIAGQPERADALFQKAVEVSTLSETYYNYASFLAVQKRSAEARDWASAFLRKAHDARYRGNSAAVVQKGQRVDRSFRLARGVVQPRQIKEHGPHRRVVEIRTA